MRLNTFVHVDDTWYGPGRDLPEHVAAKITNPKVVVEGRPRGNASREQWAAYAEGVGVRVSEDMNRDAIIAAVDDPRKG